MHNSTGGPTPTTRHSGTRIAALGVFAIGAVFLYYSVVGAASLFVEDFDYTAASLLSAGGWTAHSGAGTNAITVVAPGLIYPGYPSSGIGNAISLTTSGEDDSHVFTAQTSGSVYAAAMVNVSAAQNTGDYFLHFFQGSVGGGTFRARVFVKKDPASTNFAFGIQVGSTLNTVYTGFTYVPGTTYLIVVKYAFVSGSNNDSVAFFVNPVLNGIEPAPALITSDSGQADATNINGVALRQGSAGQAATLRVDGIRVGDSWADATAVVTDAAPTLTSASPANGATGVAPGTNLSVTFSEPVNVSATWFQIVCPTSGTRNVADTVVTGGPTTFTIDPTADLADGETCTLTVFAAQVADQDTNDPPDNMAANFSASFTTTSTADPCTVAYTPTYRIQGSGLTVPITGTATTRGVVVGDYEGASPALRGFYIQDPAGDGDPATSDGLFVFEGSNADTVSLGDIVVVTGTVAENQGQSQISVGAITRCGTGGVVPADVVFPVASADFLERYEGMLVRVPQTMTVTEHFQLGRFGEVVLSADGRLPQPTNVAAPGAPALLLQAQNDLKRVILDDASQSQNPDPIVFARGGQPLSATNTLRGGDTATGIVGVLTYTWAGNAASGNAYRIRPINAIGGSVNFQPSNPRPAAAPTVGGLVKVVGMNLLNFFNTFGAGNCRGGVTGAVMDCRGAGNAAEFARQWPKTVAAIVAMSPDVLGANELENDGYGQTSAIQFLVDQINAAAGPGTYSFIDVDAKAGQPDAMGDDAIKVAMLYKPSAVTPVGQTAALNTVVFVNGGDNGPRNRASLAQAFQVNATGARFIVNANHLKSKGSACNAADALDGQGNCNQVRTNAAIALVDWLASNPTGTGDPDVLLVGDYNSYAKEDPISTITSAGYMNLIESFVGPAAYSYVFDGQWGYLDHALSSPSLLAQVTGVGEYHINSDEPSVLDYNTDFKSAGQINSLYAEDQFRVSDHDPVVVGLNPEPLRCDVNADGEVTLADLTLIRARNNQNASGPADPFDPNRDGRINVADLRVLPAASDPVMLDFGRREGLPFGCSQAERVRDDSSGVLPGQVLLTVSASKGRSICS